MKEKLCLCGAFLMGSAAGFAACKRMCKGSCGAGDELIPVVFMPKAMAKKAKKIKKDLRAAVEDLKDDLT